MTISSADIFCAQDIPYPDKAYLQSRIPHIPFFIFTKAYVKIIIFAKQKISIRKK